MSSLISSIAAGSSYICSQWLVLPKMVVTYFKLLYSEHVLQYHDFVPLRSSLSND